MNKELKGALVWAGGIVGVALSLSLARRLGHVDAETVTRIVIGLNGLMIAWYGNRMPKAFVPNIHARRWARVAGWSLVSSGLVYAALWAWAPIAVAVAGGCAAVVAGIATTLGHALSLRSKLGATR